MRLYTRQRLVEFWARHPAARQPLKAWFREAESAHWETPSEVRARFGSADFVGSDRIIFNIGGNKFRLIVRVVYASKKHQLSGILFVRFVGTHSEYDEIDPAKI